MVVQLLDKPSNAARTDLALPVLLLVVSPSAAESCSAVPEADIALGRGRSATSNQLKLMRGLAGLSASPTELSVDANDAGHPDGQFCKDCASQRMF